MCICRRTLGLCLGHVKLFQRIFFFLDWRILHTSHFPCKFSWRSGFTIFLSDSGKKIRIPISYHLVPRSTLGVVAWSPPLLYSKTKSNVEETGGKWNCGQMKRKGLRMLNILENPWKSQRRCEKYFSMLFQNSKYFRYKINFLSQKIKFWQFLNYVCNLVFEKLKNPDIRYQKSKI